MLRLFQDRMVPLTEIFWKKKIGLSILLNVFRIHYYYPHLAQIPKKKTAKVS